MQFQNKFQVNVSNSLIIYGNIIAVFFAVVINSLANILPINGQNTGQISDSLPNLFAPAGYVFAIWFPIYIGWFVFVFYLLLNKSSILVQKINIWFIVNMIANGIWILTWHYRLFELSVIVMIILLFTLILMYLRVNSGIRDYKSKSSMAVEIPLSLYFAWISVATIANITALLVFYKISFADLYPIITVIVLIVAFAIFSLVITLHKDYIFSLVFIWSFLGIYVKQLTNEPLVAYSALVLVILLAVYSIFVYLKK